MQIGNLGGHYLGYFPNIPLALGVIRAGCITYERVLYDSEKVYHTSWKGRGGSGKFYAMAVNILSAFSISCALRDLVYFPEIRAIVSGGLGRLLKMRS